MKCSKCKMKIPDDAKVCGYCGNSTEEQGSHNKALTISSLIAAIPIVAIYLCWHSLYENFGWEIWVGCLVIDCLIFKFYFKGEFSKL